METSVQDIGQPDRGEFVTLPYEEACFSHDKRVALHRNGFPNRC
jgi:hypothetical protein